MVVLDDQVGAEYDGIGEKSLIFSPDSKRFAYGALKGTEALWWWWIRMEFAGMDFDAVNAPDFLARMPSGWAYVATQGGKQLIVTDGRAGAEHDVVCNPIFSPDGKRMAYLVEDGLISGPVEVDGRSAAAAYEAVGVRNRHWFLSPDSKHFAYAAKSAAKWSMRSQMPNLGRRMTELAFRHLARIVKEWDTKAVRDGKGIVWW